MKIEMYNVEKIVPYARNPRKNSEAVDKVASSIKEFGFKQPIVIDGEDTIIVGHTRLLAAKKLGLKEVPVLIAKDLNEQQIKAYRIADNKTAEYSEWDEELLILELEELQQQDYDIDLTGFDNSELEDILVREGVYLTDEDEIPPINKEVEPTSKYGQIYQLGHHRVMCGDSTKSEHIKELMDGKTADILFSSPPYNIGKGKMYENYEDDLSDNEYINFQLDVLNGFSRYLNGIAFWNISYNKNNKEYYIDLMYNIVHKTPLRMRELIAWDKGHAMPIIQKNAITRQQEQILMLDIEDDDSIEWLFCGDNNIDKPFFKKTSKKLTNYWEIKTGKTQLSDEVKHLACFPVALPEKALEISTKEKNIVQDPFLGSGSTLIAAENSNRVCYGMELDPVYVDVIITRWENYTGEKAELV